MVSESLLGLHDLCFLLVLVPISLPTNLPDACTLAHLFKEFVLYGPAEKEDLLLTSEPHASKETVSSLLHRQDSVGNEPQSRCCTMKHHALQSKVRTCRRYPTRQEAGLPMGRVEIESRDRTKGWDWAYRTGRSNHLLVARKHAEPRRYHGPLVVRAGIP